MEVRCGGLMFFSKGAALDWLALAFLCAWIVHGKA